MQIPDELFLGESNRYIEFVRKKLYLFFYSHFAGWLVLWQNYGSDTAYATPLTYDRCRSTHCGKTVISNYPNVRIWKPEHHRWCGPIL